MNDEKWVLIAALLPSGVELNIIDDDSCEITDGSNQVTIVSNDNSYVINGKTLHFEDIDDDVINTLLVPYILQELDGQRRL